MNKGEQTKATILEAATNIASKEGLGGLSIGTLAKKLGLSKSGLFAHFGSKDALLMAVTEAASQRFIAVVIRPAFQEPAGRPRLERLFENWLDWSESREFPGGCPIMAATLELDDRPGPLRDYLLSQQRKWLGTIGQAAKIAIGMGHLAESSDSEQFAFEFNAIGFGYHFSNRFLREPHARQQARTAFQSLLARNSDTAKPPAPDQSNIACEKGNRKR